MVDKAALAEIEARIQLVEDNLRQLQEQAAAYSGAADEERNADRIAAQEAKLEALLKEREALMGKGRLGGDLLVSPARSPAGSRRR